MPMDSSLAPFGQVLRKLCLFEPLQSRESLPRTAVPGRCPGTAPHSNGHNSELTPPIEVILSILELPRHELRIADGLTLMPPSLRGWEAFPTPGALTHTRITWALSPTVPRVPGVTPGSPLCPWCFGHSSWRGARHSPHQTESMPSSTILVVGTPILKLPSSMVRHCVYLRARPPQCT